MPKRRSSAKRSTKRRSPAKRSTKRRSPAKRSTKRRSPGKRSTKRRSPGKRTTVKSSPRSSQARTSGFPLSMPAMFDPNNLMGKPSMFKRTDKYIIYDIPRQYSGLKDEQLYERMKNMSREEAWNEFKKFKAEEAKKDEEIRQREEYLDNRYGGLDW